MHISFSTRLTILLVCLLIVALCGVLAVVRHLLVSDHLQLAERTLKESHQGIEEFLSFYRTQFIAQASGVASLPTVVTVVESGNAATVKDTMLGFQDSLLATHCHVFDSFAERLASPIGDYAALSNSALNLSETMVKSALAGQTSSEFIASADGLHFIVAIPIGTVSQPAGVLLVGRTFDDKFATICRKFSGLDVAFIMHDRVAGASRNEAPMRDAFLSARKQGLGKIETTDALAFISELTSTINPEAASGPAQTAHSSHALLVWQSLAHVRHSITQLTTALMGVGTLAAILSIVIGVIMIRRATAPIRSAAELLEAMAAGDTTRRLPINRSDELGRLAKAINTTVDDMQKSLAEAARISAMVEHSPVALLYADRDYIIRYANPTARTLLEQFTELLELPASGVVAAPLNLIHAEKNAWSTILSSNAPLPYRTTFIIDHISAVATAITDHQGQRLGTIVALDVITTEVAAEQREQQMVKNLTTAADHVGDNSKKVSASTEQLMELTNNIAVNVKEAGTVAHEGRGVADSTFVMVDRLNVSSQAIGTIVQTIEAIAKQTHLLALNATIEAARAGTYGLGFAVVAQEVKNLASKTAESTKDINNRVIALRQEAGQAADALGRISTIINRICEVQENVSASVAQQSHTAESINTCIRDAAEGISQIATDLSSMTKSGTRDAVSAAA
jgi:methyl-accepting chemotaxis protein